VCELCVRTSQFCCTFTGVSVCCVCVSTQFVAMRALTPISDQRQCVLSESLSYASTSGGSSGLLSCSRIVSAGKKRSNQNWHGPGESDCLIKTKHCDGR
jgi:hypothetical protein